LRRQGKSRRQIKEILGPMSNSTLDKALKGEPPHEWTRRPRGKDDLKTRADELRSQGLDLEEIPTALGVAKSSVSLWVRDLPRPARLSYAECRKRAAEGAHRYWAAERPVREARRAEAAKQPQPRSERSPTANSSSQVPSPTGARVPRTSPADVPTAWCSSTATRISSSSS
jgi:hypothetical protein